MIYEIFEFLDHFHVYNAFFDLNTRYRQLLTHSNLPIQIDLSSLSKSAYRRYNADIIEHDMDRISGFRTSNPCMQDLVLTSLEKMLPFNRLESLSLVNIEYTYLESLLDRFFCLSRLSSLTIAMIDHVSNKTNIYRQIFRLPVLKYCKISWSGSAWRDNSSLSECKDEFSPIENLIITTSISIYELNTLLSYVPQLRRLSIYLERTWSFPQQKRLSMCNQLNHVNLRVDNIRFQTLEQMFMEILPSSEVVHLTLTVHDASDDAYLNASQWEQLITIYIPNLQIFDLQCDVSMHDENSRLDIDKQFSSSFWIKRQWSFAHHFYYKRFSQHTLLRSTNVFKYDSQKMKILIRIL